MDGTVLAGEPFLGLQHHGQNIHENDKLTIEATEKRDSLTGPKAILSFLKAYPPDGPTTTTGPQTEYQEVMSLGDQMEPESLIKAMKLVVGPRADPTQHPLFNPLVAL